MLVNAWIYDYAPASRIDRLERALFERDYLRTMRLITVQNEAVGMRLVHAGAMRDRLHVTGNMKFDVLEQAAPVHAPNASPSTLAGLAADLRPCLVAGCVGKAEQRPLISAFCMLRKVHASARLVIAPRHPENPDHIENLLRLLDGEGLHWTRRSQHGDAPLTEDCDCLILDTFGELARFYSVAAIAYVGRDHNVLEPLAYDVPVAVLSGWKPIFPSYPVYSLLSERKVLAEAEDFEGLARIWIDVLNGRSGHRDGRQVASKKLQPFRGATARNLELALSHLEARSDVR